ncbi:hypothetical protein Tco_0405742 [Tanacetum coccineum]
MAYNGNGNEYPYNDYEDDNDNVTLIKKLDASTPLHLHPNDSSTLTDAKNKIGFIDKTCRRSNTDEVLGKQWDRCNVVLLS